VRRIGHEKLLHASSDYWMIYCKCAVILLANKAATQTSRGWPSQQGTVITLSIFASFVMFVS